MKNKVVHLKNSFISVCILSLFIAMPVLARGELEEIIVTAQKRSASLQDVPIAITAFSSDTIEDLNITTIKDLQSYTPGLNVVQSNPSRTRIRIRGIGSSKFDVGSDPSVGVFIDEIYMPRLSGGDFSLLNIERIEVLKGPQGTLFGRNTAGGAISIVSTQPSDTFEGYVEAGFGNESSYLLRGSVSGPVSDKLSMGFSAGTEELGGFKVNLNTGNEDDETSSAARWQAVYEASDDLRISGSLSYNKQELDVIGGLSRATLPGNQTVSFLSSPILSPTTVSTDPYAESINHDGSMDADTTMATFRIEKSFDNFEFVALTGYRESDLKLFEDFDRTSLDIGLSEIDEDSKTYSQEFRLVADKWIAGVYLYKDDAYRSDDFSWFSGSLPYFVGGGMNTRDNTIVDIETTSWAIFGEYIFDLTDKWALTVGGRYTDDSKDAVLSAETEMTFVPLVIVPYSHTENLSWDSFDPKVNLTYQVSDDAMLFATYSTGFKSGGVQFTATSEAVAAQTFDPEELTAYEAGFKTQLIDQSLRFNGSIFYYDYEDLQQQRVNVTISPVALTTNAAESEVKGMELDLSWVPFEQASVSMTYNYLDAEFTEYEDGIGNDFSGNPLPNTPEHTLSLIVDYDFSLPSDWTATVGTAWFWSDEQNFDVDNGDATQLDSFKTGSARLDILSPDQKLSLELYIENITDEDYDKEILRRDTEVLYTPVDSRRYGARVQYRF